MKNKTTIYQSSNPLARAVMD